MKSAADAFVEFARVGKSYDGHTLAVEDFSLRIPQGEFVTLLGPSGCGKTTCLKMLAGFEHPTAGEIFLKGQPVGQIRAHKRNIGVVFQQYALFPHMTVAENLAFPLQARRVPAQQVAASVARALDMVQLSDFADRLPGQMSGGQQQRAAIARALVFEPDIVLMDEPLGALDRRLREEMQYEIRRLQQRLGVTMLYVTHDQGEAMAMSDRVAVMSEGRIQQIASPEVLYEEPERVFVATFIGENNLLDGRVVEWDAASCRVRRRRRRGRAGHRSGLSRSRSTAPTSRPSSPFARNASRSTPAPGRYSNVFDARVLDMIFMGDHLRLHTEVLGRAPFIVKIPEHRRPRGRAPGRHRATGLARDRLQGARLPPGAASAYTASAGARCRSRCSFGAKRRPRAADRKSTPKERLA